MAVHSNTTRGSGKKRRGYFHDQHAEVYAVRVAGRCMEPEIPAGAAVLCDKLAPLRVGDLAIIYWRRNLLPRGMFPGQLKRLVSMPMGRIPQLPWDAGLSPGLTPCITIEMLSPRKRLFVPLSDLEAIHRCCGVVEVDPYGNAIVDWSTIFAARNDTERSPVSRRSAR